MPDTLNTGNLRVDFPILWVTIIAGFFTKYNGWFVDDLCQIWERDLSFKLIPALRIKLLRRFLLRHSQQAKKKKNLW